MSDTEQELVRRTLDGDRTAFEELVRKYEQFVFSIAYHYLGSDDMIEDLAQDVFLRVYETLDRYDPSRPLKHWIGRITSNRCIDELRRRKRRRLISMTEMEEKETAGELVGLSAPDQLSDEQSARAWALFQSALGRLPLAERSAFVLHDLEQMEYPEVARLLGTTQVAVRIRVSRARRKLQQRMEELLNG